MPERPAPAAAAPHRAPAAVGDGAPVAGRVLIVTPDYPPAHGGIQTLMGKLGRLLPASALEVVTFDHPEAPAYDGAHAVTVHRVPARARAIRIAALSGRALREAARFRPDVALLGHAAAAPAGAVLRRAGIPTATYAHAEEFRVWPARSRFAMRHTDAVIAVSRHTRTMAVAAGAPADRVHLIHHGVDTPDAVTPRVSGARPPTVITVARLRDLHKGHDVMLQAMTVVRRRVPGARWVVLGDGPLRPRYEQLARELGLGSAVDFVGGASDGERDAWLRRADVFAMPTRLPDGARGGEGFGIAYLEAAAYGLPVVAANAGGAVDAVDAGATGLLVDPTDHRQVADALVSLLAEPWRAQAMGRRAIAWAQRFPWQRTADQVADVLRLVADGAGR
jgi:phosphatidyl-myo-inositol dimannoside synthase